MGRRQLNRLTVKEAESAEPGLHCDGGGLYLQVKSASSKAWIFRYRSPVTGQLRDMGLGPFHSVTLSDARLKSGKQRSILQDRRDPIEVREAEALMLAADAAKALTFTQCAASYIEAYKPSWRNVKHLSQWENTLSTYADPILGSLRVQDIDTALVLQVLEPIWSKKPETAGRLRARIANILDWAKARGYRTGENPARWRGHLNQVLPTLAKRSRVVHHKAMPSSQVAEFITHLRRSSAISARCLEFTILTACRTNEAISNLQLLLLSAHQAAYGDPQLALGGAYDISAHREEEKRLKLSFLRPWNGKNVRRNLHGRSGGSSQEEARPAVAA